jgi:hypothetical protein
VAKRRRGETTRKGRARRSRRREGDVKEYLVRHDENVDPRPPARDPTRGTPGPAPPPPLPREAGELLAQAALLLSASSLRQYAALFDVVGRRVPDLARALQGGETSDGDAADKLRACLREIADASVEEARRLREEVERIDQRTAPPAADTGEHWRRWKAKP